LAIAQDHREVYFFPGSVYIAFCINKCIQSGAVAVFAAYFKTEVFYFGIAEGQVIEIFGRFGDDHSRTETGKLFLDIATSATPSALVALMPNTWLLLPYTTMFTPFTGWAVFIELANTNSLSLPLSRSNQYLIWR
jgi:hypothetical protein